MPREGAIIIQCNINITNTFQVKSVSGFPFSRCSKKGKKEGSKAGKKVAEKASMDKASTEAKKEEPEAAIGPNMEQSYQEKV